MFKSLSLTLTGKDEKGVTVFFQTRGRVSRQLGSDDAIDNALLEMEQQVNKLCGLRLHINTERVPQ